MIDELDRSMHLRIAAYLCISGRCFLTEFIRLSYTLTGMLFTLAHEMGHALHSYYSDENQPYIYAGYKIFVAEVASTCNEALLVNYLIDNSADRKEKMYLINYFLEQFRTTFFRQTMFAEFERITHRMAADGETLTAENMCDIYKKLNEEYMAHLMSKSKYTV